MWTYEQKFNALITGNLVGQDSWTLLGGDFNALVSEEAAAIFEGAKGVKVTGSGGAMRRIVADVNAGIMFIAMKKTSNSAGAFNLGLLQSSDLYISEFEFRSDGTIKYYGTGGYQTYGSYVGNQWYVVAVEWDQVAHPSQWRCRVHNGISWGGWTAWNNTTNGNAAVVGKIQMSGGGETLYFDTITPTNPSGETPWTYEQKFNNYADGNLVGQDNWGVVNDNSPVIQTTIKYEGAKAVDLTGGGRVGAWRNIFPTTIGKFYFAMRANTTFPVHDNSSMVAFGNTLIPEQLNGVMFGMRNTAGTPYLAYLSSDGNWHTIQNITLGIWYVIEIDYVGFTNSYKYRVFQEGVGWGAQSGWVECWQTVGAITKVIIYKEGSSGGGYFDTITLTDPTLFPPEKPKNLQCENLINPTNVIDSTPELSAEFDDRNVGAQATAYKIQIIESGGDWGSPIWDSGKQGISPPINLGERHEVSYGGTPLALDSKKYYQRWKFWDNDDMEGEWSNGTDYWRMGYLFKSSPVSPGQDARADQYNDLRDDVKGAHHRTPEGTPIEDWDLTPGRHLLTDDEYNYRLAFLGMIVGWLEVVPPNLWLLCNGATINKITNSEYTALVDFLNSLIGLPPFTDNFNGYSDGVLNGQGGWAGPTAYEIGAWGYSGKGIRAVGSSGGISPIKKTGTPKLSGTVRFRTKVTIAGNNTSVGFSLYEGTTQKVYGYARGDGIWIWITGDVMFKLGDISVNNWQIIDIEWRASDHKIRGRVDGGTWSDWKTPAQPAWVGGLDTFGIDYWGTLNAYCYFDEIQGVPPDDPNEATLPNITDHIIKY